MIPIGGIWVTLHRVGRDDAGPIDSVRTTAEGRFSLRYRTRGRADAIYFISATRGGVAYFSLPLRSPVVTGPDAELTVFDTTSSGVPLHVRGRHGIVGPARGESGSGARDVTEVYEMSNDSSVTSVPRDTATPVWTAIVPGEATGFEVRPSDIAPDAVTFSGGRLRLFAPLGPGLKQIAFSYRVPMRAFPLAIPVEGPTPVLEVLVDDVRAQVTGAQLGEVESAVIGGRRLRRFLVQDAPPAGVVRIELPPGGRSSRSVYVATVAIATLGVMLVTLSIVARRRGSGWQARLRGVDALADDVERIAADIARIDAVELEPGLRSDGVDDVWRHAAVERRMALKRELAAALARRSGST
ncbi:MAG: hypothetical protein NVS9B3_04550 [Gemmatimonadaceae bacterium]